jgi:ABC-type lipoprotein export system ATPase subunit
MIPSKAGFRDGAAARRPQEGTTVIVITHEAWVAAYVGRQVIVREGTVSTLTGVAP